MRVGESDSRPYQATLIVLDGQGTVIQSFQTNADGTFHVALPPGDYLLHSELSGPLPRASDQAVAVVAGQYAQVQITYDSGLR